MKTSHLLIVVVVMCFAVSADAIGTIVPAYFPWWTAEGRADFETLKSSAATLGPKFSVIINMASGPTACTWGYWIDFFDFATSIHNSGGFVYAYVDTAYGGRPTELVTGDMDLWTATCTEVPNQGKTLPLDGFFFDQSSSDIAQLSIYETWYNYAKTKLPAGKVILNPGNVAEGSQPYVNVADIINVFENQDWVFQTWTPPSWMATTAPSTCEFASMVWNCGNYKKAISKSTASNIGYTYPTNLVVNQYNSLPRYWDKFIKTI